MCYFLLWRYCWNVDCIITNVCIMNDDDLLCLILGAMFVTGFVLGTVLGLLL